jgi:hypothetical protein
MKKYFLSLFIILGPIVYAESMTIEECIKIENNKERLACFDLVTKSLEGNEKSPAIAKISKPEKKTISQKIKQQVKDFGLTKKEKKEVLQITSKIARVKLQNNLKLLVVLENGQKWRSVENFRRTRLKEGQMVEISEGFISGYSLKVVDKKIALRVKRIK